MMVQWIDFRGATIGIAILLHHVGRCSYPSLLLEQCYWGRHTKNLQLLDHCGFISQSLPFHPMGYFSRLCIQPSLKVSLLSILIWSSFILFHVDTAGYCKGLWTFSAYASASRFRPCEAFQTINHLDILRISATPPFGLFLPWGRAPHLLFLSDRFLLNSDWRSTTTIHDPNRSSLSLVN